MAWSMVGYVKVLNFRDSTVVVKDQQSSPSPIIMSKAAVCELQVVKGKVSVRAEI